MRNVLAVLSILLGLLASVVVVVMLLAGAANSSAAEVQRSGVMLLVATFGGLACALSGTVLVWRGRPRIGAAAGGLPAMVLAGLIVLFGL